MDFKNAKELLELSQNEKLTISEVMRQRELLKQKVLRKNCIQKWNGCWRS